MTPPPCGACLSARAKLLSSGAPVCVPCYRDAMSGHNRQEFEMKYDEMTASEVIADLNGPGHTNEDGEVWDGEDFVSRAEHEAATWSDDVPGAKPHVEPQPTITEEELREAEAAFCLEGTWQEGVRAALTAAYKVRADR